MLLFQMFLNKRSEEFSWLYPPPLSKIALVKDSSHSSCTCPHSTCVQNLRGCSCQVTPPHLLGGAGAAESTERSMWGKGDKNQGQLNKQEASTKSPSPPALPLPFPSIAGCKSKLSPQRTDWDRNRFWLWATVLENNPLILSTIQQINAAGIGVCSCYKKFKWFWENNPEATCKRRGKSHWIRKLFKFRSHWKTWELRFRQFLGLFLKHTDALTRGILLFIACSQRTSADPFKEVTSQAFHGLQQALVMLLGWWYWSLSCEVGRIAVNLDTLEY